MSRQNLKNNDSLEFGAKVTQPSWIRYEDDFLDKVLDLASDAYLVETGTASAEKELRYLLAMISKVTTDRKNR